MTDRKKTHQSQGDQRKNAIKNDPEQVINNPAMQYTGGGKNLGNINDPGNSVGGGLANSRNLNEDENLTNSDYNKAGQLRNQGENEQHANDNVDDSKARPQGKYSGQEGKTMVKNNGTHNNGEANL